MEYLYEWGVDDLAEFAYEPDKLLRITRSKPRPNKNLIKLYLFERKPQKHLPYRRRNY